MCCDSAAIVRQRSDNIRRFLHRLRPPCRSSLAIVREVIGQLRRGISLLFWTGVQRQCCNSDHGSANIRRHLHRLRPPCRSSPVVAREVIGQLSRGITLWSSHGVLGCVPDVSSGLSQLFLRPRPGYPWKIIHVCVWVSPKKSWGAFQRAPGVPSTGVLGSYLGGVRLRPLHEEGEIGLDKKGGSSFHLCTACTASASGFGLLGMLFAG